MKVIVRLAINPRWPRHQQSREHGALSIVLANTDRPILLHQISESGGTSYPSKEPRCPSIHVQAPTTLQVRQ